MIKLCFVCLGNICRSPTAEGIMKALVSKFSLENSIEVDSAGTGAWHSGEKADPRSRAVAQTRGLDLTSRSRQFKSEDFSEFDYVLAMDNSNLQNLRALADETSSTKLFLLRSFDPQSPKSADVPDPYYGGPRGFEDVFDICEAACTGLLHYIQKNDLQQK